MKLVLLPGLDGTGNLFAPVVAALSDIECEVISYPPDRELDYAGHEAHVRGLLPDDDHVLLAESFSGPVGISIAAKAPTGLRGLILCCSFASNPLPMLGALRRLIGAIPAAKIPAPLLAPFLYAGHSTAELRGAYRDAIAKVSARTLRARATAILAVDHRPLLRQIGVPMLYLLANNDRLVPRSAFVAIKQVRSDIRVEQIDGPHFLLQTQPERCARLIREFICGLDPTADEQRLSSR